jgi:perosamine synthetase
MKNDFIPVAEPVLGKIEREYLIDAFDSGWISAGGEYSKKLEDDFSSFCGVKYGSTVSNGTVALHLAVRALGLVNGDEVIVPNFNGIYGAYALLYEGVVPVPIDAEKGTWNIDPNLIEKSITSKTKAIMVVHLYGHPCNMDPIKAIAKKYNLFIIEDAAEAHGAEYNGRKAGSFGDISTFSFFSNKVITSGEGGIVLTDNEELYKKVEYFKNQCFHPDGPRNFIHEDIGYNYRLTNLQSAIAYAQFTHIEELINARISINKKYREILQDIEGIHFQDEREYAKNIFWMTGIIIDSDKAGFTRNQLEHHLANNNIQTRRLFVGMDRQPVLMKYDYCIEGSFPISDILADNGLYLPTSSLLSDSSINRIAETIKELI